MTDFIQHPNGLWVPDSISISERAEVYCDESGNSGPNYLDADQPFYVLAGWFIPHARMADVAVAVDQFRTRYFPQRSELKSSAVLRNDQTKERCAEFFLALGQLDCVPMYLVAEKRYCIAGKIVETFLDPAYNDLLKNPFTFDVTTKQELANTLYRVLPKDVLAQFADAYREPTASGLGKALRDMTKTIESYVSPELAKAIAGCEKHIDKIAEVEAETSPLGDVEGTLNMPCLVSFLMLVENLGRLGVARPIKVVHDQQHAYQDGYQRIFKMHKGMPRLFARLPHSDFGYSNLEHVAEFEMRDSKSSPLIQAADLLAGVIHHCFKLATQRGNPTNGDLKLAGIVLPGLLASEPRLTWSICSEDCFQQLGQRVFKPALQLLDPAISSADATKKIQSGVAPMFPINEREPKDAAVKLKVDLPLFGIVGRKNKSLMIVTNPDAEEGEVESVLFLFSSKDKALEFLGAWDEDELIEPQEIVEFGPRNIDQLTELLDAASKYCELMTIDPDGGPPRFTLVSEFKTNMSRIMNRIRRVFASGLDSIIMQKHQVAGAEILSLYCHEGNYAAMAPSGRIYFGKSREEAVAELQMKEFPTSQHADL